MTIMDWHLVITALSFAVTTAVFIWKMGGFTSRLETILHSLQKQLSSLEGEVKEMRQDAIDIARLETRLDAHDSRISNLESKLYETGSK